MIAYDTTFNMHSKADRRPAWSEPHTN